MNWLKVIFLLQILLFSSQMVAQNKQLEKANKRYQIKKYAEAIPLYEEGLEKNPNQGAKARLAYCYRINNDIEKSVNLYGELVQHKRAKSITWYYYGEALMSQGKYDEAKIWLKKYTEKKPGDKKGWALLESINKVKTIEPYYKVDNVEPFAHNSESDDSAPVFFRDGIAFSSDRKTGAKIMKRKSAFTGRDFLSIYLSKGKGDGTFKSPSQISKRVNDLNKNTGTIALSPDEKMVVFSRNSDISNRRDQYNLMLYRADVTPEGKFRNVTLMEFCNNNSNHMHPTFSPDGKTIFFTSDKSGVGGTDIFYSTLSEKGWSRARNLDEPVNTPANEGFPFMSSDGKLFFCSKGHPSYGGFDIFVSEKDEKGNWSQPINIGSPINSPADDISIYLSKDLKKGMFASSREGGDDDIYFFDINGMHRSSNNMMAENPTTEETLVSNSENKTIIAEPIIENSTETSSDGFEITLETLNELNEVSQNTTTEKINETMSTSPSEKIEEVASHSVGKNDLPNTSVDSFEEKINTESKVNPISNNEMNIPQTEEMPATTSEKRDLPFAPAEPFEEKIKTENSADVISQIKNNNTPTNVISSNPSEKSDLPFAPVEPFKEKVNTESSVNNISKNEMNISQTEEMNSAPSEKSDLPFAPAEPFEEKVNTESSVNPIPQNEMNIPQTEEMPATPSKKSDLPFAPAEPFEEKVNTESRGNPISNNEMNIPQTEEMPAANSEKSDLPFAPTEPFEEKVNTESSVNSIPQDENIFETTEENSTSKFEEGLASVDAPMTDATPATSKNEGTSGDANIAEMKEYLMLQSPQEEAIFVLEKIKFEPEKYTLTDEMTTRLDELVKLMNEFPALSIEVNAHTESIGDDRKNMVSSIKRATAVAGYLIRRGIGTDRVKVMGYGETQLINHCGNGVNCSPEEHAVNQRVELKILNQ